MKSFVFVMLCVVSIRMVAQDCVMASGTCPPLIQSPYGSPEQLNQFIPNDFVKVDIYIKVLRYSNGTGGIPASQITTAINKLNNDFQAAKIFFQVVNTQYINSDDYYTLSNDFERNGIISDFGESSGINIFFSRGESIVKCIPTKYVFVDSATQVFNNFTSLPHEMGHALGLYHTHEELFFGTECANNQSIAGDLLSDTPPDLFTKKNTDVSTCSTPGNQTDDCGFSYNPLVNNYMSGYQECRTTFTNQQIGRMHYILQNYLYDVMYVPVIIANHVNNVLHTNSSLTVNNSLQVNSGDPALYLRHHITPSVKTNSERLNGDNKHNNWNNDLKYFHLSESIPFYDIENLDRVAKFISLAPITINTNVDGFASTVKFKDPWFVSDATGSQTNTFNQYQTPYSPKGYYSASSGGVFLGMAYNDPELPFYEVEAPSIIDGRPTYLVSNWIISGSGSLETPQTYRSKVRFDATNTELSINLKGQLMTNVNTSFVNPGQQKILRTNDGQLHLYYESIGKIWHEYSSNGGSTWEEPYFILDDGKTPSVCSNGSSSFLAYQQNVEGLATIRIISLNSNFFYYDLVTSLPYSASLNPAIALSENGLLLLVWQDSKIKYKFFTTTSNSITEFTGNNNTGQFGAGTSNIHLTPAISLSNPEDGFSDVFHLVWEQKNSTTSNIMYKKFGKKNGAIDITRFPLQSVSTGGGYTWNYLPSVTTVGIESQINWIGQRVNPINPEIIDNASLFKRNNNTHIWAYGSSVTGTQINKSNNGFLLAYSQANTIYSKDNTNYSGPTINAVNGVTGGTVQVAEGFSNNQFYVSALNTSLQPYRFSVSSITLSKGQSQTIANGRTGVLSQDSAEFYFVLGDISVNGVPIEFISFNDTLQFPTVYDLNNVLTTKPFYLSNTSQFLYSIQYGITDSVSAISVIGESGFVNFKVELVDAQTGDLIGSYDDVSFNKYNPTHYNNLAYQVNTEGVGSRMVRLRLVVNYNGFQPTFGVTDRQSTGSVLDNLGKHEKQTQLISFKGSLAVKEYVLNQNYPNPFNPTTTIEYALPKPGNVLIKVYDLLGKEVETLVNSYKESGRHNVIFDASRLSSGVYIYKISTDKFSDMKKLVILK